MVFEKKKIAVFGYDFGGAFNTIIFLLKKKYNFQKIDFFFFGPSKRCFYLVKQKIFVKKNLSNLKNYELAIYSLSNKKNRELSFLKAVKKKKIYTKLIIDGWGNYKNKMSFQKNNFLPQEIITFDAAAYRIISKLFKKTKVKLYKNLIFDYLKNRISIKKKKYFLFLRNKSLNQKKIIKKIIFICKEKKINLKIRDHPSNFSNNKSVINSMFKDLSNAKFILGDYSSMLIYGSILGCKSLCYCKKGFDKFNWNKYGIFNEFNIKKIYNINNLSNLI